VEYAPKQPLRYYASYTRAGLGGPNSLSGEVGWQDEPFGEASFTRDFFLFGTLEKRLQLSVRGFSDYQAERLLAGTEVDERRNGGEASANLDLLRDGNGHWLRLDLAGGYREVIVDRFGQRVESGGLATADLGFLYLYHWDGTPGSARLELQPNVRLGYANDGGNYYATPSLTATYHRFISSFNQWECHASGLWSSSETPLTELPSFGGETSVRGYRADAGTGRATWAIQNEFWFPLRYRFGLPESMDKIIRRNFAIAPFFDIGGIHDSTDGFSGVKLGAGVGLRFIYNDSMTLRLDWANAIDESDRKRGGSMFYFSVSTRQIL
jgi:hypothetical protein